MREEGMDELGSCCAVQSSEGSNEVFAEGCFRHGLRELCFARMTAEGKEAVGASSPLGHLGPQLRRCHGPVEREMKA